MRQIFSEAQTWFYFQLTLLQCASARTDTISILQPTIIFRISSWLFRQSFESWINFPSILIIRIAIVGRCASLTKQTSSSTSQWLKAINICWNINELRKFLISVVHTQANWTEMMQSTFKVSNCILFYGFQLNCDHTNSVHFMAWQIGHNFYWAFAEKDMNM